ncbi:hypothetical protein ACB092_10G081900 [Castanea dentata]
MSKPKTIDAFFKKKDVSNSEISTPVAIETNVDTSMPNEHPSKCSRIQSEEIDRDPGSRKQICEFPINKQDEIRQVYLKEGPYQPKNIDYPYNDDTHRHRFQVSWFESHRDWLEYSPSMDAIYCLPCYLFGKDPNSPHKISLIEKQTSKELENNRLRLKTSIEGHDESLDSKNRGNFIKLIKFTSTFNDRVVSVVLENAPRNAKYTSPTIQKEILHILTSNMRNAIREEIRDSKFCILIDEARDELKREQMVIILRFVDKNGFIKEGFFHVVHVRDTTTLTLKKEICFVLSCYNVHIENIRGQGYDGASDMRGEWNGLQDLFLKECLYAYYVHCMAHRLQVALVTASREVKVVHQLFDHLTNIINIVVGYSEHNGANQIGTLQQAGDTRWGSHFQSICSLIKMFDATCKIMGITNILCQAFQQHSQDLLNVMHLVSTTKSLIQKLRDDGWEPLLASVKSFCGQHEIDISNLNAHFQLQELNSRFCELIANLLTLSLALNSKDAFRSFKIGDICNLARNYYPQDFSEGLEISRKSKFYHLIDRLIRLVLTLPVSTTTTK